MTRPDTPREIAHAIAETDRRIGQGVGIFGNEDSWQIRMHPSTWIRVMNDSEGVTWLQPDHDAEPVGVAVEEYSGYRFMNLPVVIDAALIHGMFEIRSSRLFMLPNI